MTEDEAYRAIADELDRAMRKFPMWPNDPSHGVVILMEEVGELAQAVTKTFYEGGSMSAIQMEAVQVAAMAVRFLMSIDRYDWSHSLQHAQS